ncbi:uncharacterized protein YpuA (DUF1002 family) [Enterococcus rivorum]|uniref:Inosine-5-monophosphate dehydrogenase n=1 Tax=Enterococcus rivorum TaxID=762845 RepID=A0A1E5KZ71_9ENTE|nr:DUF1002 domain-containing protein [Enterococcus rivorum]MBP2097523.1 uncharacterized protein YpuA (DUF1002 family) [Enterococcus rivorum]OEH82979.1 inosine-5-monophosphate dehydrogenase [Enterococcus rivorum]
MINFKKSFALLAVTIFGVSQLNTPLALATENSSPVVNERWGKPTFVSGAGLTSTQLQETMKILDVNPNDVTSTTATGADLIKYLGSGSGDDSVMLSSVLVTRENAGKGINVDIVTPENITSITADQYKNPLITAGITDATIKVGSVVRVTGESALTGVYKAFEKNGEEVNADRAQLAQDELEISSQIAQSIINQSNKVNENQNLTDSEQEKLDEAQKTQLSQTLVDIKKALADFKEQQGKTATKEEVQKIVDDALAKNNISEYVSSADISSLVALAQRYQTTEGVLSKESLAQLDKISKGFEKTINNLGNELGKFGDLLKGKLDGSKGFFAGIWENITSFFGNLFN